MPPTTQRGESSPAADVAQRSFCAELAAAEPLAGTAPHRPVWALVEHPGPWGHDALLDAAWPVARLGERLGAAGEASGVKVVLARRPGRRGAPDVAIDPADRRALRRVLVARCGPGGLLIHRTVPTDALADLDWTALAAATSVPAGWAGASPIWGVCTHGTRDACCARVGRPLAQAFEQARPGTTWEISHTGGHRFAGVALALPTGLMYGRLPPEAAPAVLSATADGRLVDAVLRGEVHRPQVDQVATAALRAHLGEDRIAALTRDGDLWAHTARDGTLTRWRLAVTAGPGPVRPSSCGAAPSASTVLRVTSLTQV